MGYINDIRNELLRKELATESSLVGVSVEDINRIEKQASVLLPRAYKDFLISFGKKAGFFASDVVFFYSEILDLREELNEMIEEEGLDFEVPENAFVFSGYQGFQYHYFICDGRGDPEIYRIMDGGESTQKVAESFSGYLKSMVN